MQVCTALAPTVAHGAPVARPVVGAHPAATCVRRVVPRGLGRDAVEGWLDVSKLVASAGSQKKSAFGELASAIGRDIHVDIAGWHLFLRDMGSGASGFKMADVLATQLGPKGSVRESEVEDLLKQIPVKLGGGKVKVSLYDVMPSMVVGDLTKLLEEHARR